MEEFGTEKIVKSREEYIENIQIGNLVAFKVANEKVLSGMVKEINGVTLTIETKNGIRFMVRKRNIIWVKTGKRWPRGVYLALKGGVDNGGQTSEIN